MPPLVGSRVERLLVFCHRLVVAAETRQQNPQVGADGRFVRAQSQKRTIALYGSFEVSGLLQFARVTQKAFGRN